MQEFKAYPASCPDGLRSRSTILPPFAVVMASYAAAMLLAAETRDNPQVNKGKSGMAEIFSFRPSSVIHFRITANRNEEELNHITYKQLQLWRMK